VSVIYAVLSTFSIALSDFFASAVTKRERANEVTSTVLLAGVVVMAVAAVFWSGNPTTSDLVHGALAGAANGVGILLLYVAYSRGSLRSTAPTAAVVMSGVPVLWDVLVSGTSPSTVTSIGLSLGVVAIALSSYERGDSDNGSADLFVAALAGVVFGILLILLSYIGDDAGGSPLLLQRVVAFLVAISVTRSTGPRIFPSERNAFITSFVAGIFGIAALVLFLLALRGGSLAVVSVVASQYAAVAVLLGVAIRGQRMWWWQALGLGGSSLAVALIAIG
jgi:drug/metabolite transporter (DMT)-like permease